MTIPACHPENKYYAKGLCVSCYGRLHYLGHKDTRNRYLETNRQRIAEKKQTWRRHLRMEIILSYGGKCECCAETRFEFLAIDHVNGGGNKQRKQMAPTTIYTMLRDQGFPNGYRILCNNCNQAYGNYGYCPHEEQG